MKHPTTDDKIWSALTKLNPAFSTGDAYPTRSEFLLAKTMVFDQELTKFSNNFSKLLFRIQKKLEEIESLTTYSKLD